MHENLRKNVTFKSLLLSAVGCFAGPRRSGFEELLGRVGAAEAATAEALKALAAYAAEATTSDGIHED